MINFLKSKPTLGVPSKKHIFIYKRPAHPPTTDPMRSHRKPCAWVPEVPYLHRARERPDEDLPSQLLREDPQKLLRLRGLSNPAGNETRARSCSGGDFHGSLLGPENGGHHKPLLRRGCARKIIAASKRRCLESWNGLKGKKGAGGAKREKETLMFKVQNRTCHVPCLAFLTFDCNFKLATALV